ncbi:PLP-dependent aminotransferase family protein [Actinokineospora sp. HUAS TT18]|uniref:aminotransferase-like domain-containing protein n=1 Tax=Actinokineospora sp. HUAS TT18 TaxID=3447451 RepID=UPI003F526CB7
MWRPTDLNPADGTKARQVAESVRRAISAGKLSVGTRLPSERDLAARLGVSRVTVVRALDLLRADDVIETGHGSGSVVRPADRLLDPVGPVRAQGPVVDLRSATAAAPQEVAVAAAEILDQRFRAAMATDGPPVGGSWELREALAAHLTARGTPTRPGNLTITVGATAALDLALTALNPAPGRALTETPTYPAALAVLRGHRLDPVGWPVDWDLDQAAHLLRRTRLSAVYLQVDNHSPTGRTMPADRRAPLVDLVRGVPLIADEALRPLGFGPQPPPLSARPGVIGVGSLSKTIWGGLLIGWIRAPQALTKVIQASPRAMLMRPSSADELLALALLDRFDTIVERRRRLLRTNLAALESALAGLPVSWESPSGGMVLWLRVGDSRAVTTAAARRGLLLSPGDLSTPDGGDRHHIRFPYTSTPAELRAAVAVLAELL